MRSVASSDDRASAGQSSPAACAPVVSSATLPPADRFEWFADLVAGTLVATAISCENPLEFRAQVTALELGAVQVSAFDYDAVRARRTPALIRRSDPEQYQLALVTGNPMWINQCRNESGLIGGDLVLWDTSRPYEAGAPSGGGMVRAVVVQVPRAALPLRADKVADLVARRIPGGRGMGAILAQFISSVIVQGALCTPQEQSRLGEIALDLTAACLAQQLDAYDELPAEVRTRAQLERINAFIDYNLDDPELSPQLVAAHHHMSVRRLHLLFQGQPESVAASIRSRRLARCHADLTRPELSGWPIHAIAARWGLTSAAAFSRAFREVYGLSPSELRQQEACVIRQGILRSVDSGASG